MRGLGEGHVWAAALAFLLITGACAQEGTETAGQAPPGVETLASAAVAAPEAEPAPAPISWTHFDPPAAPEFTADLVAEGGTLYAGNCASCHGDKGGADGVCSPFLSPQPRDFTKSIYRFKTTEAGEMPMDADIFRTISLGLHGTGMPPWQFLLTEHERWALVAYVKTLSPDFADADAAEPVELGEEPHHVTPEQMARGQELYAAACVDCHGARGYGDGKSAKQGLKDAYGNPISPRNFHKGPTFKRGHTLRDIALTIHTGNDGTPMPAFTETYPAEDIWAIAGYIYSLDNPRLSGSGTPASATKGEQLGTPDVVVALTERKWKFIPNQIQVTQGEVVRIDFQPTDNGLGVGHGFAIDGYDKTTFINGALVQRPKSVTFRADKAGTFTFYCATQCSTGSLHPKMNGTFIVAAATN